MAKVGVILSGCGVYDGAEVHEAVLTLLALDRAGAEVECLAPDIPQLHVVNHATGQPVAGESRNVLVEAARIARGAPRNLTRVKGSDYDAIILPGGFGAAKNLSTFAVDGADCRVNPEVARVLKEAHAAGRPICAICIAPAILARLFGAEKVKVTIGTDAATAQTLEKMGACHEKCPVESFVADRKRKIVTTPAYMLGPTIKHVAEGIERAIRATLEMVT